ncbi:hypothetical protein LSAT2_027408 [Lamellibrachia satsuma]|nr:hypothetical protein LSAT2_027408 [Lamellibrachia satsuma]
MQPLIRRVSPFLAFGKRIGIFHWLTGSFDKFRGVFHGFTRHWDNDIDVSVASTSTSVTDCQANASATTSDSVAVVATGTAAMPSCASHTKLALIRGLVDQDVAVRDDGSTATASVTDSTCDSPHWCIMDLCCISGLLETINCPQCQCDEDKPEFSNVVAILFVALETGGSDRFPIKKPEFMLSKRQQAKIRRQNEAALAKDEDVDWTPQLEREQDNHWNDEAPKPMIWKPPPIETKAPLVFYNLSKELLLENDLSDYGLGSVLLQEGIGKSVAYTSHSLSCAERHYAQIEKEMLSLLLGLGKFHHYTYGRDVDVVTDHKPLVAVRARALGKALKCLQHMLLNSQEYSYTIVYKPGKYIPVTDGLSRGPTDDPVTDEVTINSITLTAFDHDRTRGATLQDSILQELGPVIMDR